MSPSVPITVPITIPIGTDVDKRYAEIKEHRNVLRNEDWNRNGPVHENVTLPMTLKELSCPYGVLMVS